MEFVRAISECLCGRQYDVLEDTWVPDRMAMASKRPVHAPSMDEAAAKIVATIRHAEKNTKQLRSQLKDELNTQSWSEDFARSILDALVAALQEGRDRMGQALSEAVDKATDAAEAAFAFAKDHPLAAAGLITIVAIGVLVLFSPWVVELLGFAELGPVEGSFAAWWQSTYAGFIPKGSLFSFLQRLGMTWARS